MFGSPIDPCPNEIENPIRFDQDEEHRAYDAEYAHRFWRALVQADRVFKTFRARFIGKVQPGALLLGQFRSGGHPILGSTSAAASRRRSAFARLGGAGSVFARSQQCGFWPGGGAIRYPAF